jgi:carbon-monoxide dehydrogenase catalytic subunit
MAAEIGFSAENIGEAFGGFAKLAEELRAGRILGIANLVGCNNPKIVYEKAIVELTERMLAANVLILTNGCASFPLMKLGYCAAGSADKAAEPLRGILKARGLPAALHIGECLDTARSSAVFHGLAEACGKPMYKMPFAYLSPEWSNEKGTASPLSFRVAGISSYHCVYPPVFGSKKVSDYLFEGSREALGAVMGVRPDPAELADKIVADFKEKGSEM